MLGRDDLVRLAAVLAVAAALAISAWRSLAVVSFNREMLARVVTGTPVNRRAVFLARLDAFVAERIPDSNVFLRFEGYGADPASPDGRFVFEQFLRTSYLLWPRRVLVSATPVEIRGAADILRDNRVPDDAWLCGHGVRRVVVLGKGPAGPLVEVRPVKGEAPCGGR